MYSLMVMLNKQSRNITGMENSVLQLTVSFLLMAVFIGVKQHFVMEMNAASIPWILLLGLINTGFGCYLYFTSLSKLPVQTVAVCGYLEPLSAVFFAMLLQGESMTLVQTVGEVFIIVGAMVGELMKSRSTVEEKQNI